MSVNPKEKKALQGMWDKSETAGSELPDGTYQFTIQSARFHMTEKGKPTFKTKLKVSGGAQDFIGQELEINDNLETAENMGWFKKKLQRLNIALPEDFDEVTDGTVAEQMKGKMFEGQVKTKNDFMNVYVNRLLGEGPADEGDESDDAEEENKSTSDFDEGDNVTWNGKTGEVVEILSTGKARVKKEDGTVVRVDLDLLEKAESEEDEEDEDEDEGEDEEKENDDSGEDGEDGDELTLPSADEVEEMKMPDIRNTLKRIGIKANDIKNPRGVLHAFCALAEDPKAKIELTEVSPLASALDVKLKKGESFKDSLKALAKAVKEFIS